MPQMYGIATDVPATLVCLRQIPQRRDNGRSGAQEYTEISGKIERFIRLSQKLVVAGAR